MGRSERNKVVWDAEAKAFAEQAFRDGMKVWRIARVLRCAKERINGHLEGIGISPTSYDKREKDSPEERRRAASVLKSGTRETLEQRLISVLGPVFTIRGDSVFLDGRPASMRQLVIMANERLKREGKPLIHYPGINPLWR